MGHIVTKTLKPFKPTLATVLRIVPCVLCSLRTIIILEYVYLPQSKTLYFAQIPVQLNPM